jgi:CMP-N-acetylneuraminic acid synthetase
MIKVVQHAVLCMNEDFKAVVVLQPTTPQRVAREIAQALEVFSARALPLCTVNPNGRRNGGAYIVNPRRLEGRDTLWGKVWMAYETPYWVDIDTPEDLELAREWMGP